MTQSLRAMVYAPDNSMAHLLVRVFEMSMFKTVGVTEADNLFAIREQYRPDIVFAYVYFGDVYHHLHRELVMQGIPTIFASSNYDLTHVYERRYRLYQHLVRILPMPFGFDELKATMKALLAERRADVAWLNQIYEVDNNA